MVTAEQSLVQVGSFGVFVMNLPIPNGVIKVAFPVEIIAPLYSQNAIRGAILKTFLFLMRIYAANF